MPSAIVNPTSGSGRAKSMWPRIQKELESKYGEVKTYFTKGPGDAGDLAVQCIHEKSDLVFLVGGDGTLHEAANGLMTKTDVGQREKTKFAILNSGRGCDFSKSIGIPADPFETINKLDLNRSTRIDIGSVKIGTENTEHYFINSSSFGIGAEVAAKVQRKKTRVSPKLAYGIATLKEFIGYKPTDVEVKVDGEIKFKGKALNVFVCNGQYSGGGMHWAPNAKLDDGLLDIVLIEPVSVGRFLKSAKSLYNGSISEAEGVSSFRGKSVEIKSEKPGVRLELDGEVYEGNHLYFQQRASQIEFLI